MVAVEIRRLGPGDEAVLDRLAEGVFDDPIHVRAATEFIEDPRQHLVVAMEGETVIGFASAVRYGHPDKVRPELWINEVGVAPAYQARGVGKAILRELVGLASELGCAEAWVLTDRENLPALRLYRSVGGLEAPGEVVMFTIPLEGGPA